MISEQAHVQRLLLAHRQYQVANLSSLFRFVILVCNVIRMLFRTSDPTGVTSTMIFPSLVTCQRSHIAILWGFMLIFCSGRVIIVQACRYGMILYSWLAWVTWHTRTTPGIMIP